MQGPVDPVANATNATVAAKMQGPVDPVTTNATTNTATMTQESSHQRSYKDAADFKTKNAKHQQAWYSNLSEDKRQKILEQKRECDRKRREAKRKLRLETQLKQTKELD